jgi:hypothetical protein
MSEIKHIEGPWRFVDREVLEDGSVYPQHIVGGPDELQVCFLEGSAVAALAIKEKWPNGKPRSADLLLAAPDLLALLVELVDIEGPCPGTAVWATKVHAAIAKARGAA